MKLLPIHAKENKIDTLIVCNEKKSHNSEKKVCELKARRESFLFTGAFKFFVVHLSFLLTLKFYIAFALSKKITKSKCSLSKCLDILMNMLYQLSFKALKFF